jgi:DNA-directed RNA polymerase specialized sigma24 family protein
VTSTSARAEQIAAFYARHADRLQRIVRAKVHAPAQTIEDACQNAWAILVRRDDIPLDDRGASWLATVAIREGWRLMSDARDVPMGAMRPGVPGEGELPEPEAAEPSADEQAIARIEHAQRVADLRTLKARECRDLYLLALGYRYNEICDLTTSSYTAVNRRLTEGRARLRRLARERDPKFFAGGQPVSRALTVVLLPERVGERSAALRYSDWGSDHG